MATKTKTKPQKNAREVPVPAPLLGPQTEAEWIGTTLRNIQRPDATADDREAYRDLLALRPDLFEQSGNLARMARDQRRGALIKNAYLDESVKHQIKRLRVSLGWEAASALERLLIDVILGCWQDYYLFQMVYGQQISESFRLNDMEHWERILVSKEARYVRAVAELAKVRRLLNLPPSQLNINLPGGQQVNVAAGELKV